MTAVLGRIRSAPSNDVAQNRWRIVMALFAGVPDHLEAKHGFRVDGVSMSVYTTILTVVNGLIVNIWVRSVFE